MGFTNRLVFTDVVIVIWAVFGSQFAWFGLSESNIALSGRLQALALNYTGISLALSIVWVLLLTASGSRDRRVIGTGTTEYRLVVNSSLMLFGLFAIVAYLFKAELARGYLVTALPIGILGLIVTRWLWRQYLQSKRFDGAMSSRVLLLGSIDSVSHIAGELIARPEAGYRVVGACVSPASELRIVPGTDIVIFGTLDDTTSSIEASGADTVVVAGANELQPEAMRQLSWSLEPGRQHLVVAPGLTDIAGPRIHTRPVAGLPLIHVETPRYEGSKRAVKRLFDIAASLAMLLLLSLPLTAIAIVVKTTSAGPVFFRQTRVGLDGSNFAMLKFRSMVNDAEAKLAALADDQRDAGNSIMFKMADDPRITSAGKFLRRFSLDELPQLFNVLRGEMALVGPRPSLPSEVAQYEQHVNRRFLVKPGITGLWQVSGRSNLDWESTVRLDLYYVENWSLTGDLVILWRTFSAVLEREGAY